MFIDLEKAYDIVHKETMEMFGGKKRSQWRILEFYCFRDIYNGAKTNVRTVGEDKEFFDVGLDQGSSLSPSLFFIVMDELIRTIQGE